jgi:hypothetical protein
MKHSWWHLMLVIHTFFKENILHSQWLFAWHRTSIFTCYLSEQFSSFFQHAKWYKINFSWIQASPWESSCQDYHLGTSILYDVCDVTLSVQGSIPTVARPIFQSCPVWIYTLRVTSQTSYSPKYITPTQKKKHTVYLLKPCVRMSGISRAFWPALCKQVALLVRVRAS